MQYLVFEKEKRGEEEKRGRGEEESRGEEERRRREEKRGEERSRGEPEDDISFICLPSVRSGPPIIAVDHLSSICRPVFFCLS